MAMEHQTRHWYTKFFLKNKLFYYLAYMTRASLTSETHYSYSTSTCKLLRQSDSPPTPSHPCHPTCRVRCGVVPPPSPSVVHRVFFIVPGLALHHHLSDYPPSSSQQKGIFPPLFIFMFHRICHRIFHVSSSFYFHVSPYLSFMFLRLLF